VGTKLERIAVVVLEELGNRKKGENHHFEEEKKKEGWVGAQAEEAPRRKVVALETWQAPATPREH
jgi:hypothetical protein